MKQLIRSSRISKINSDIRGPLYQEALAMEKRGEKVLKLNTGNPASFGFEMPASVRDAVANNIDLATAYCDVRGMDAAREAILEYHRAKGFQDICMDDIFLGNGVSELVNMAMNALIDNGDEVLLPTPNYSLWANCTYLSGGVPVYYNCDEKNNWCPDIEDIKSKITSKTKAIVIINPNNPTGSLYPDQNLLEMLEIARQNDLVVLSDEIYDRLVLDGKVHKSAAALAPDLPIITMNGLSKSHIICGFRCGWLVISGGEKMRDFAEGLFALAAMRLCGNAFTQLAVPAALADAESTKSMLLPGGRLYEQREAACSVLEKIDGLSFVKNDAAFYLFPKLDKEKFNITSDKKFALDLLVAKKILIIPGSGFDYNDDSHFRIVMLPKPERLAAAMNDLGDFLSDYKQN